MYLFHEPITIIGSRSTGNTFSNIAAALRYIATQPPPPASLTLFNAAEKAREYNELSKALDLYTQTLTILNKYTTLNASGLTIKIQCLNHSAYCGQELQYDLQTVIAICTTVLELDANNVEALQRRGAIYEQVKEYHNALDDMIALSENHFSLLNAYTQKKVTNSIERLSNIVEGNPRPAKKKVSFQSNVNFLNDSIVNNHTSRNQPQEKYTSSSSSASSNIAPNPNQQPKPITQPPLSSSSSSSSLNVAPKPNQQQPISQPPPLSSSVSPGWAAQKRKDLLQQQRLQQQEIDMKKYSTLKYLQPGNVVMVLYGQQKYAKANILCHVPTGIKIQWLENNATQLILAANVNIRLRALTTKEKKKQPNTKQTKKKPATTKPMQQPKQSQSVQTSQTSQSSSTQFLPISQDDDFEKPIVLKRKTPPKKQSHGGKKIKKRKKTNTKKTIVVVMEPRKIQEYQAIIKKHGLPAVIPLMKLHKRTAAEIQHIVQLHEKETATLSKALQAPQAPQATTSSSSSSSSTFIPLAVPHAVPHAVPLAVPNAVPPTILPGSSSKAISKTNRTSQRKMLSLIASHNGSPSTQNAVQLHQKKDRVRVQWNGGKWYDATVDTYFVQDNTYDVVFDEDNSVGKIHAKHVKKYVASKMSKTKTAAAPREVTNKRKRNAGSSEDEESEERLRISSNSNASNKKPRVSSSSSSSSSSSIYKCLKCDFTSTNGGAFATHMKSHSGIMKTCEYCGYKSDIKSHFVRGSRHFHNCNEGNAAHAAQRKRRERKKKDRSNQEEEEEEEESSEESDEPFACDHCEGVFQHRAKCPTLHLSAYELKKEGACKECLKPYLKGNYSYCLDHRDPNPAAGEVNDALNDAVGGAVDDAAANVNVSLGVDDNAAVARTTLKEWFLSLGLGSKGIELFDLLWMEGIENMEILRQVDDALLKDIGVKLVQRRLLMKAISKL